MTIRPKNEYKVDLENSSLTQYESRFSYQLALGRGAIVDVTAWTTSQFGVGRAGASIRVGVTAGLWSMMVKSCIGSTNIEVIEGDENDILSLAEAALERARQRGEAAANFYVLLGGCGEGEIETEQMLRVEEQEEPKGNKYVVIGFPADFAKL